MKYVFSQGDFEYLDTLFYKLDEGLEARGQVDFGFLRRKIRSMLDRAEEIKE